MWKLHDYKFVFIKLEYGLINQVPLIVKYVRYNNTMVKEWVFVLLLLMAIIQATLIHVSKKNYRFSQLQIGTIVDILK